MSIDEWLQWAKDDRCDFLNTVKRACHRARVHSYDQDHKMRWRRRLDQYTHTTAIQAFPGEAPAGQKKYVCYECGRTEASAQQLRAHITKEHLGAHHPVAWATGTVCVACGYEFHSR